MTESPGVLFERLLDVMMRLRAPDGCPWDRVQTRTSLKPYLIEEAYEVLEAIESGRSAPLQEELGALLFQVVFHARLAEELGEFTTADLLRQLIDKMVRRHPHVFGDASVGTATEALAQWEAIKQREADERGQRRSILDGVPRALPALLRAQRVQTKASLVNVARLATLDAEEALHGAIEKFRQRFTDMEAELAARGTSVSAVAPDELERAWNAAKAEERSEKRP